MIESPRCPLCENSVFQEVNRRVFKRSKVGTTWSRRMRNRVLFEEWHPTSDEVTIAAMLCNSCGFVGIEPRPTPTQIERKYQIYDESSKRQKSECGEVVPHARKVDRKRSEELLGWVGRFVPRWEIDVLDFGGRSGALMTEFVARGARCAVVDVSRLAPIPGVEHLGSRLEHVEASRRFDAIVLSHVLEHVADPLSIVRAVGCRLTTEGMLFIEVPLELQGTVPPLKNPVAHISYFSEPSIRYLLLKGGLRVVEVWTENGTFESGEFGTAIRAVARRLETGCANPELQTLGDAAREVRELMKGCPDRGIRGPTRSESGSDQADEIA